MEQSGALILSCERTDSNSDKTRTYQFIIPVGAPYGEVVDIAFELLNQTQSMLNQAVAQNTQPQSNNLTAVTKTSSSQSDSPEA